MTILIIIFLFFIFFSAYLSSLHIAFLSQNEYSVLAISGKDENKLTSLKELIPLKVNIIISIVSLKLIVNICATILCTDIISDFIIKCPNDDYMDIYISIIVSITIILLFGEIIPCILGNAKSNSICYRSVGFLKLLCKSSKPFIGFISNIKKIILSIIKKETISLTHPTTVEEVKLIAVHANEAGIIEDFGYKMITRAHFFNTLETCDVMIPFNKVITLKASDNLEVIRSLFKNNMYSRIPVLNEDESDIIGIFNYKELCSDNFVNETFNIKDHLQKPLYVPDSINISRLFEKMREDKSQLAVVQNEYGSFIGIVTMSDIMDRIFGKIDDEYEDNKQSRMIEKTKSVNEATVDGSTSLTDLMNILKIKFDTQTISDFKTLNGFLVNLKGGFLNENEEFLHKGYSFKILSVRNQFAEKIFIKEN